MKYWISWYQPTEDERPIIVPPKKEINGYWNSGQRMSDDAWTMVALVATDEPEKTIQKYWPEAAEWRFCEERPDDYVPGDRFPME